MKNLRNTLQAKMNLDDRLMSLVNVKQSRLKSGDTFVVLSYPMECEYRRPNYAVCAAGFTPKDCSAIDAAIKSIGADPTHGNRATVIL